MLAKKRNQEVKEKSKRNRGFSFRIVEPEMVVRHLERYSCDAGACSLLNEKSTKTSLDSRKQKGWS